MERSFTVSGRGGPPFDLDFIGMLHRLRQVLGSLEPQPRVGGIYQSWFSPWRGHGRGPAHCTCSRTLDIGTVFWNVKFFRDRPVLGGLDTEDGEVAFEAGLRRRLAR